MRVWLLGAMLSASTACVVRVREGSGDVITEQRSVGAFTGVIADHAFDVDIVAGDADAVSVFCDDNLVEHVLTEVEDGDLVIERVRTDGPFVAIDPTVRCHVDVVAARLERVASSGSGHVTVSGRPDGLPFDALSLVLSAGSGGLEVTGPVASPAFEVSSSGSGRVDVAAVITGTLTLGNAGSGGVSVDDGAAGEIDATLSGSGPIDARAVQAAEASVFSSGSGGMQLTVTDLLEAHLSGSGGITVFGNPASRSVDDTGSGSVTFE